MLSSDPTKNQHIIQIYNHELTQKSLQDFVHQSHERFGCIS
jgi:hypothetical protein